MKEEISQLALLKPERRQEAVNLIIGYFKQVRGEEIGIIAAEEFLDFFLQNIGNEIYNKGVLDVKKTLRNSFDNWEIAVDILLRKKD